MRSVKIRTALPCRLGAVSIGLLVVGSLGCHPKRQATISLDAFLDKSEEHIAAARPDRAVDLTRLTAADMPGADYRLGPGDLVTVTIFQLERPETPSVLTVRVSPDGKVALPMIGETAAGGLRPTDLEAEIRNRLSPRFLRNPRVSVVVAEYHQVSVLVLGAVANPGTVLLKTNERTLVHVLSRAAGLTQTASGRVVIRPAASPGAEETYQIDREEEFARALARKPLGDGDIIFVREGTVPIIYVHGIVEAPGPLQIPRTGVSVLQALVAAGGLPTEYNADQAYLTRRFQDGSEHTVQFDLEELAMGDIPNVLMQPGDILEVPHTAKTRTADWAMHNLVFRAGVDGVLNPWPYFLTPKYQIDDNNDDGIGNLIKQDMLLRASRQITQPLGF